MSNAFSIICEQDHHHDPVIPGSDWWDWNSEGGYSPTALQVENYSLPRPGSVYHHPRTKWRLNSSALSCMFITSSLVLTLQWGTMGAAVIIIWFTPTIGEHIVTLLSLPVPNPLLLLLGLGCRLVSYLTYGILSTVVWMMLLISSILTYYLTNTLTHSFQGHVAHWLSIFLRHLGKLITGLNAA